MTENIPDIITREDLDQRQKVLKETRRIVGFINAANGWLNVEPGWYRADVDPTTYTDEDLANAEFVLNNEDTDGPFETKAEAIGS